MSQTKSEKGQDLAEYALLLALIAIVVIAALLLLGPQIAAIFNQITAALGGV
jgi:pilus assembly protein Flp/PilA